MARTRKAKPPAVESGPVVPSPAPAMRRQDQVSGVAPDPNVALRVLIQGIVGMREGDGPQRTHFKRQILAYALVQGPNDEIPGPALTPSFAAELLGMSLPAVCNARTRTRARIESHRGFEIHVRDVVERLKAAFARIGESNDN